MLTVKRCLLLDGSPQREEPDQATIGLDDGTLITVTCSQGVAPYQFFYITNINAQGPSAKKLEAFTEDPKTLESFTHMREIYQKSVDKNGIPPTEQGRVREIIEIIDQAIARQEVELRLEGREYGLIAEGDRAIVSFPFYAIASLKLGIITSISS